MKKTFSLLIAGIIAVLTFSCTDKEEIFKPQNRLFKVWERSEVDKDNPNQEFIYNAKQINRIDSIYNYNPETGARSHFVFEYSKDNTVNTITLSDSVSTETIKLLYVSQQLTKVAYIIDGAPRIEFIFTRDMKTGKVKRITQSFERLFFEDLKRIKASDFYNFFLGFSDEVLEFAEKNASKAALELFCEIDVVYTKDNISQIKEVYYHPDDTEVIVTDFLYDDTFNPYYGLPFPYTNNKLTGYSRNNKSEANITKTKKSNTTYQNIIYDNKYELNDNQYPKRIITGKGPEYVPVNTYFLYKE